MAVVFLEMLPLLLMPLMMWAVIVLCRCVCVCATPWNRLFGQSFGWSFVRSFVCWFVCLFVLSMVLASSAEISRSLSLSIFLPLSLFVACCRRDVSDCHFGFCFDKTISALRRQRQVFWTCIWIYREPLNRFLRTKRSAS